MDSDIDSDDYGFVNGTASTDEFPTIQLNSFGTYNITVTAGSNCDTPASDTIVITLSRANNKYHYSSRCMFFRAISSV